jgi:hypothetical protein
VAFTLIYSEADNSIALPRGETVIGRSLACTVVLNDDDVSRRHVRIVVSDDALLEDLGSANGTLLNGERIDGPRALNAGDRIDIGTHRFDVREERRRQSPSGGRPGLEPLDELFDEQSYDDGGSTRSRDALALLTQSVRAWLEDGDKARAESAVSALLEQRLQDAKAGGLGGDPDAVAAAASAAALLAGAGLRRWARYVLELACATGQVPPDDAIAVFESDPPDAREAELLGACLDKLAAARAERLQPDERRRYERLCAIVREVQR